MRHLNTIALAVCLLLPAVSRAQVPPDKALETFTVADGLELSLFASEPMMVNPTSIDVDHKGRVWVCEAVNYRRKNFGRPILRKEGDRIIVLEDTKGDGKADKVHVFYQGPEIVAPLGICVAPMASDKASPARKGGDSLRVYVCQSPDILVFEDKDGDLKADGPPKKLLTGFNGFDHDHGVHGINIGPDMKLYFTVGDTGVRNLKSSDGKGKVFNSNSTDCRAGTVWRCDMDGKNLELIAHNFRNNYECCVNSFGDIWLSDNDDDGNQQTRICYVMPGGNYGYHPRGPGQSHWHEEQPGVVHKVMRTGFGSPCGITFYEGTALPKKYHGQLIHADAGPREVRCFHIKPKGAGFEAEKENLVTSKDTWFRPSDVCVGPDGSVFIADWYDPGVGGHGMGDWTRGRIYRLTPKGQLAYKVPEVKLEKNEDILKVLASPNQSVRYLAITKFHLLHDPDDNNKLREARNIIDKGVTEDEPVLRARTMWLDHSARKPTGWGNRSPHGVMERPDPDIRIQILAERLIADRQRETGSTPGEVKIPIPASALPDFARGLGGNYAKRNLAIAREALFGLQWVDNRDLYLAPWFYGLASLYDGKDRFYLNAIGIAAGTDPKRREIILADFEKHFPEWNDKVADLVWELRPPSMMPKLANTLSDKSLSAASRARIVDILASSDDKSAGMAMLDVLKSDAPAEVRARALDNLRLFLPTKWNAVAKSEELGTSIRAMLNDPKARATGLELVAAAQYEPAVKAISDIVLEEQIPADARLQAVRTLARVRSMASTETLDRVWAYGDSAALRIAAIAGLGEHITAKADTPSAKKALQALQFIVKNKGALETRLAGVRALSGSQAGTTWLLNQAEKKEFSQDLVADAGRLLRNSPYQGLRNRAMVLFPAPGKLDLKKLPSIAALAIRRGDVERGRQVFTASAKNDLACAKCHTVRGTGGFIGPDLSMIGKKASRENMLESMLDPSKAVADQFINWQIETKKGVIITGLVIEETPEHVLLRDANGKDTKLARNEIESKTKNPKSIMPEDIVAHMTEQDLLDLTEYLLTLKTPALAIPSWSIVGPFDNGEGDAGLEKVFPPEKAVNLKGMYLGKSGKVSWKTVKPDGTGYVNLQAHYGAEGTQIVSYLYREIESPADQEATLLIGNDDCCKVWVNGELVHKDMRHVAATPEMSKIAVKLKKGVNKVLVKINNGDGPHGLYFSVVSEQELKALK